MNLAAKANVVAERLLGPIEWIDAASGYCECPGCQRHTTPDGKRDCKVWAGTRVTVYCVHTSCGAEIAATNANLRQQLNQGRCGDRFSPLSATLQVQRLLQRHNAQALKADEEDFKAELAAFLPYIIDRFAWSEEEIRRESPVPIAESPEDHGHLLLSSLYGPNDNLWIGDKYDSGRPEHGTCFRQVSLWLSSRLMGR